MNYLIVCHDAGGAEVVSAWVKANPQHNYNFILAGPALPIFMRKLAGLEVKGFEGPDVVLAGTGSGVEKAEITRARQRGIKTIAYLDHWVNYEKRFDILPDEIWVGDDRALELAQKTFPDTTIKLVPNLYFIEMKIAIIECGVQSSPDNILYVCEPTEEAALERFMNSVEGPVRIRRHPSESAPKYEGFGIISSGTLAEDIAWAHKVVGVDSMALTIAELAGKEVERL